MSYQQRVHARRRRAFILLALGLVVASIAAIITYVVSGPILPTDIVSVRQDGASAPQVAKPTPPPIAPDDHDGMAARARGLVALEEGDYTTAITNFEKAQSLGGKSEDLDEMLRIARELRDRSSGTAAVDNPPQPTNRTKRPKH